jgi:hypothetical protein
MGVNMDITGIFVWFQTHWIEIVNVITGVIAVASIIVKLTPTLKDDTFLLAVIKFLSKYVALNRTVNDEAVRTGTPT